MLQASEYAVGRRSHRVSIGSVQRSIGWDRRTMLHSGPSTCARSRIRELSSRSGSKEADLAVSLPGLTNFWLPVWSHKSCDTHGRKARGCAPEQVDPDTVARSI
jgi:hypothetical protein